MCMIWKQEYLLFRCLLSLKNFTLQSWGLNKQTQNYVIINVLNKMCIKALSVLDKVLKLGYLDITVDY